MRCPHCGGTIDEVVKCSDCGGRLKESEAIKVGGVTRCSMCAAGVVGRKHREAERPRMPDPVDDPAGWERTWRAARNRRGG